MAFFPERWLEAKYPRSQREQRLGKASWRGSRGVLVFKVTNAPAFRPAPESCELLRARLRWGAGGPCGWLFSTRTRWNYGAPTPGTWELASPCADATLATSTRFTTDKHTGYPPTRSIQPLELRLLLSK